MNLESIQEMWEKDSKIDTDLYCEESVKIPSLHAKYHSLLNTFSTLKIDREQELNKLLRDKWIYYKGKAPSKLYAEMPFDLKLTNRDEVETFVNADSDVQKARARLAYIEVCLNFLDSVIRTINNRGFQIKNAIDWEKFKAGF
tara:strand:- start:3647 stop:4075 length:429 start_codon:yes stop_codon:yes gene_type:complete